MLFRTQAKTLAVEVRERGIRKCSSEKWATVFWIQFTFFHIILSLRVTSWELVTGFHSRLIWAAPHIHPKAIVFCDVTRHRYTILHHRETRAQKSRSRGMRMTSYHLRGLQGSTPEKLRQLSKLLNYFLISASLHLAITGDGIGWGLITSHIAAERMP